MPAQASLVVGHLFFFCRKENFRTCRFYTPHDIHHIFFVKKGSSGGSSIKEKGRVVINEYIYTLNNCDV